MSMIVVGKKWGCTDERGSDNEHTRREPVSLRPNAPQSVPSPSRLCQSKTNPSFASKVFPEPAGSENPSGVGSFKGYVIWVADIMPTGSRYLRMCPDT